MLVACSCGKSLRISEEFLGKKIRCPSCSSIHQLASADLVESPPFTSSVVAAERTSPLAGVSTDEGASAAAREEKSIKKINIVKKSRASWLPLTTGGVVGGLLACIVVAAIIVWLNRSGEAPPRPLEPGLPPVAVVPPPGSHVVHTRQGNKEESDSQPTGAGAQKAAKQQQTDPAVPADGKESSPIFYLESAEAPTDFTAGIWHSTLLKEVVRQAVLIAARDRLNLTTRDASLGELPPDNLPKRNRARVDSVFQEAKHYRLSAHLVSSPNDEPFYQFEDKLVGAPNLFEMVNMCESHIESLIAPALKRTGFSSKPNPIKKEVEVPEATLALLDEMTYTAQFQAARELHALAKDQGESPWSLGELARAYANLGVLTEFHWHSSHKVFKARALLYAQRAVTNNPKAPLGYWYRGYACALVGLHKQALSDLARASQLERSAKNEGGAILAFAKKPAWIDLLRAYCAFDTARIDKVAKDPRLKQLADLLRYFTVEDRICFQLTLQTARTLLEDNPECYRVHDALSGMGGVASQHVTTLQGMQVFSQTFPKRLAAQPGLPATVNQLLQRNAREPEIYRALREAGRSIEDRGEPSWTALGRLAQETRFAQVCRRLYFMHYSWSVPTREFARDIMPLVEDHPCAPYVQTFLIDKRDKETYRKLLLSIPLVGYESTAINSWRPFNDVDPKLKDERFRLFHRFNDNIYRDRWLVLAFLQVNIAESLAQSLLRISTHAPIAKATLIQAGANLAENTLVAWEKDCQHPVLLRALGLRYRAEARLADSERCLKKAIALSPDGLLFQELANSYKSQGKIDLWRETLEAYLKEEDTGLGHAKARVEIAQEYMKRKEWQKALPYAEAAAQSYAAWALVCAHECNEGAGNWEQAELWLRRACERYPSGGYKWYTWCMRTGKGDIRAAEDFFVNVLVTPPGALPEHKVMYYTLSRQPKKAIEIWKALYQRSRAESLALFLASALDEAGDQQERDRILKEFPGKNTSYSLIVDQFRACLAQGEKAKLDLEAVERAMQLMTPAQRTDIAYFIGCFLEQRGQIKEAVEYHTRAVLASERILDDTRAYSAARLRGLGIAVDQLSTKK